MRVALSPPCFDPRNSPLESRFETFPPATLSEADRSAKEREAEVFSLRRIPEIDLWHLHRQLSYRRGHRDHRELRALLTTR